MQIPDPSFERVEEFIRDQRVMTLATSDAKGVWSAPVYYVYNAGGLFFFSKPDSRHIVASGKKRQVAASVYATGNDWQAIQGVQMEGSIDTAGVSVASLQSFDLYRQRFTFFHDLVSEKKEEKLRRPSVIESVFQVRWYQFIPRVVVFTDNGIHFGYRQRYVLS